MIAFTKFSAAGVTGSSAMLSEGIHSAVDTGNQLLLLYGIYRAKKPADEFFPFGYGKEIYFWSFVVAIFIFAIGSGVSMYEGIHHLYHPRPMKHIFANYIVLALAMIFEGAMADRTQGVLPQERSTWLSRDGSSGEESFGFCGFV